MSNHDVLSGSLLDFRVMRGASLLKRTEAFFQWQQARRQSGLWPYNRSTEWGPHSTECQARTDEGHFFKGINFASQDYLGLSSHPVVAEAAIDAVRRFGVHSAGSPALVGNTSLSVALEKKITQFLDMNYVTLYPTGWGAGFGAIKGLVRPDDHVVMDTLSHACLQEGAQAATRNVHYFSHNNNDSLRKQLNKIRKADTENAILVVTEGLFSMDSDSPDLLIMQKIAHEFEATLLVDVAHDLGCLGDNGQGHIGHQQMRGKIDIVMGSFSKTFASNGGFVATRHKYVNEYLRFYSSPSTFSNALSPVQAAVVSQCLDIVSSEEGSRLRQKLMNNITGLRAALEQAGFEVYGAPSPIVCVKMEREDLARLVSRHLLALGLLANLVEYPAVAKGAARFRLQVMASHTPYDIERTVTILTTAKILALQEMQTLERINKPLPEINSSHLILPTGHLHRHDTAGHDTTP